MTKPTLIMLCGIPGSGKSKWAEKYVKEHNYVIHSSDSLRKELFGDENYQDKNNELFDTLHKRIKEDLAEGKNVIYDACNIHRKFRMVFLQSIGKIDCYKKIIIFAIPYEICLRRNWMRERKVPDEVIERMYRHWQTPWYFEGWDFIDCVHSFDGYYEAFRSEGMICYNQNNPHHTKTLGNHELCAMQYVRQHGGDEILQRAAAFHDCGKPFCRFEDEKGISHYYNHENVGAYDALSLYNLSIEVSALITYHMAPINWNSCKDPEKLKRKYEGIWGKSFYNKIMLLHEADEASR